MTEGRVKVVYVARRADRTGPAGDVIRILEALPTFHVVMAFLEDPGPDALRIQHAGAMVHVLGGLAGAPVLGRWIMLERFRRFLVAFEPDVVHGLGLEASALAAIAGRMAGVPVLVGSIVEHFRDPLPRLRRAALRRLDRIIVPTDPLAGEVAAACGGPEKVSLVPPAVEAAVRGAARSAEFSQPRLRVGVWTTLETGGGLDAVLDAAAMLEERSIDVEWLVAGTGPDALPLLRETQRRGLDGRVVLLGDREDVGAFLAALDAFVSPCAHVAAPCGLLHALVLGVPCVAARNASLDRALRDGEDAILVPPGDAAALAGGVERIVADGASDLRARLRRNAPRFLERHAPEAAARALTGSYEELRRSAKS